MNKKKEITGDKVYYEVGARADFFVKVKVIMEETVGVNITEDDIFPAIVC